MKIAFSAIVAFLLVVQSHANSLGAEWFAEPDTATAQDENEKESANAEATQLAEQVEQETKVKVDAKNAKEAAGVAKEAAHVANKVAEHSVKVTTHAKSALKHAMHALHEARVDSDGLDAEQTHSLQKAENKLKEATKSADFGKLKKLAGSEDAQKKGLQDKLDGKDEKRSELEQMRKDVKELRKKLKGKRGNQESDEELEALEKDLEKLEKASENSDGTGNDEMKSELERLRDQIGKYDKNAKDKELMKDVKMQDLDGNSQAAEKPEATPVQEKGIDIDTQMPYGDLEPFGREDTAQELTESSVRESDMMVDQLERAEVAEEKRAVFRALTRLRGAAITSFDGVARSQTGNIDEYNKVNKWRKTHPIHHLADEESDVTKWAFPDNADLIQVGKPAFPDLSEWARRQ